MGDKTIRGFSKAIERQDDGVDFAAYNDDCKANAGTQDKIDSQNLKEFKTEVQGKIRG